MSATVETHAVSLKRYPVLSDRLYFAEHPRDGGDGPKTVAMAPDMDRSHDGETTLTDALLPTPAVPVRAGLTRGMTRYVFTAILLALVTTILTYTRREHSGAGYVAPERTMKVFGVGMYKTGTTSLAYALDVLGFHSAPYKNITGRTGEKYEATTTTFAPIPALQSVPIFEVHKFVRSWDEWSEIVAVAERATAFADGPWLLLYREWDELFPGSKFVLTLRKGGGRDVARSDLRMWKRLGLMRKMRAEKSEEAILRALERRYDRHVAEVRRYFRGRPDALVEICFEENSSEMNWRILVDFLDGPDGPVPEVQFPVLNTRATGWSKGARPIASRLAAAV